jgi:anti-sigma regulatory factor (Ser/Thr protein kinase)
VRAVAVEDVTQVGEARRVAEGLAKGIGFREAAVGRVAIVATELATNLIKHAGGGELLLSIAEDAQGVAVECISLDKGPGLSDLEASMRDGYSTAGSAGTGLGAIMRQSSALEIYSRPGAGTALLVRIHAESGHHPLEQPGYGAVSIPIQGEEACGDGWGVRRQDDGLTAIVVDGLGHGPLAATAAHAALRIFDQGDCQPSADLMERLHRGLRSTRGAAASVARLPDTGDVDFIGVGNVLGAVVNPDTSRRMVSYNGTLGHALKSVRPFSYPAPADALVVLASDGLGTSWSLGGYPGIWRSHPLLIAAVLYRDFKRPRDDVTVLVLRRAEP